MSVQSRNDNKDESRVSESLEEIKGDEFDGGRTLAYINRQDECVVDCVQSQTSESGDELINKEGNPLQGSRLSAMTVKSPSHPRATLYPQAGEERPEKRFTHYIIADSGLQNATTPLLDSAPLAQAVSMESVGGRTQFFDLSDEENEPESSIIKDCSFEPSSPELKNITIGDIDKQKISKIVSSSQMQLSTKTVTFEQAHTSSIAQEILPSESSHPEIQGQILAHIPVGMQVDGPYSVQLQSCHDSGENVSEAVEINSKQDDPEQSGHQHTHLYAPALITFGPAPVAPNGKVQDHMGDDTSRELVNQQWLTSKDDKGSGQSKGANWRQGMWSREEEALLKSNIEDFCKASGISDPTMVIFQTPKDERKDFYRSVAKGIQRPLFAIYRKVLRMYDNKNYMGKYTSGEVHKLQELRKKHGTNWAVIGGELGRSASSVKDRSRLLKDNKRTGKWTSEEERLLSDAVREQTKTRHGESVTTGIIWSAVMKEVGTRTEKQCRAKWLNYLNWKEAGGEQWSKADEGELITRIANIDTNDENHLDWVKLSDRWPSVRSPQWLRGKWWTLKKKVPNSQFVGFRDIIKYLQTTYMDSLKVKIDRQCVANSTTSKTPTTFRSNALSSLSSQFHRNSAKLLKKTTSDTVPSNDVCGNNSEPPVPARNIVIADGFTSNNAYDNNPQNFFQFQLAAISPQPFLLHTVQPGTFSTNLGESLVLQSINMGTSLVQTSADELVGQGEFIVQNVPDQVTEDQDDSRTVGFSQAMVQTDLSIPIPAGSITQDDLERANLEAIDDEISRNMEPLEDTADESGESHLEAQFRLGEPTVVEMQPDEIIEPTRDDKDSVSEESPGIVTITMETVRNVSINIEDNLPLDTEIGDLKEI